MLKGAVICHFHDMSCTGGAGCTMLPGSGFLVVQLNNLIGRSHNIISAHPSDVPPTKAKAL